MFGGVCQVFSVNSFMSSAMILYKTGHTDLSLVLSPINISSKPLAQYSLTEVAAYGDIKIFTDI